MPSSESKNRQNKISDEDPRLQRAVHLSVYFDFGSTTPASRQAYLGAGESMGQFFCVDHSRTRDSLFFGLRLYFLLMELILESLREDQGYGIVVLYHT